ncbi:MAG: CNP1-like family protein [Ignavibacteria bacterium]
MASFAYGFGNDPLPIHSVLKVEDEEKPWQEAEAKLPDFPKDEDLLEFYVSATTTNRFFIDGKTIAADPDGVVRFTMVVKTSGGATNISYEGIRCGTSETKLYATGVKGAWVPSRVSAWKPIENKPMNRQHAALNRDYFCPASIPIRSAEEGRNALKRGKHPDAL